MGILPDEIKPAMEGVYPSIVVSCSADGEPNTTAISQVYYVDADRVALSFQFFNKTIRNVRENPNACVYITNPETYESWVLEIEYDHSEAEGPIFEEMDIKIEAIASMTGMSGIFKLRAADIYKVKSAQKNVGERHHISA
jgi:hypothetical protein